MSADDLLRLIALDEDDLVVVSAHVQDAVLKVGDIGWLPAERRLILPINRFVWEAAPAGLFRRKTYQRRRAALHFERVEHLRSSGFDKRQRDRVLAMLAVRFAAGDAPAGEITVLFSGDAVLQLGVECVEAQLTDLGPAWSSPHLPRHVLRNR